MCRFETRWKFSDLKFHLSPLFVTRVRVFFCTNHHRSFFITCYYFTMVGMRDRHWLDLAEKTKINIPLSPPEKRNDLTLQQLVDAGLVKAVEIGKLLF